MLDAARYPARIRLGRIDHHCDRAITDHASVAVEAGKQFAPNPARSGKSRQSLDYYYPGEAGECDASR